jgi:hypothetical protein
MSGRRAAVAAAAIAYAGLLASTSPFTTGADALTALALGAAAVVLAVRLSRRSVQMAPAAIGESTGLVSALPWIVLLAVMIGWELFSFFGGPRPAHPTLSTVYDLVSRWPAVKAAIVLAWLVLGWELLC